MNPNQRRNQQLADSTTGGPNNRGEGGPQVNRLATQIARKTDPTRPGYYMEERQPSPQGRQSPDSSTHPGSRG